MPLPRRPLAALLALLYLLLAAGGEAFAHGGEPATGEAETHVHAPGEGDGHCPPPAHDEQHCPACALSGLRFLPSASGFGTLAGVPAAIRAPAAGDGPPALRSHAPTRSRAPPLG